MDRRQFIAAWAALAGLGAAPVLVAETGNTPLRLGAAWRGAAQDTPQQVGVIEVNWQADQVRVLGSVTVPTRAHGMLAEPGGGLLAVAARPGRWLLRLDAHGRLERRHDVAREAGGCRLDGHAVGSVDGRWLYTGETDAHGAGRIGVRDAVTLRKEDEWSSHGIEPHQLLLDARGHLLVANGGIRRGPGGRKLELDRMQASLVQLDSAQGALRGEWRLEDPRLSLRHLALSRPARGAPLLGIALQAEHDDPQRRARAPVLALWDGHSLHLPAGGAELEGYAGDIAPAADGGFVISNAIRDAAWLWQPSAPSEFTIVARLTRAYALADWDTQGTGGVLIAAARGVARWHPSLAGAMLPWPQPMALDNHWVRLAA